ncbi:MAG: hypothetical protein N2C12_17850, partial [Planctomycetales bacterium]
MDHTESTFRSAALASRLLTKADIEEALDALHCDASGFPLTAIEKTDEQLASMLVEMKRLNKWQAE